MAPADDPSSTRTAPAGAVFSPCTRYRYVLWRDVYPQGFFSHDQQLGTVAFLMLNPSTAGASTNDATVRRCLAYALAWQYRRLVVVNLFALRAKAPTLLYGAEDPEGNETRSAEGHTNDAHLVAETTAADLVVLAWGNHGGLRNRAETVRRGLRVAPFVLRVTKRGEPEHPLRLPRGLRPQPWATRALGSGGAT